MASRVIGLVTRLAAVVVGFTGMGLGLFLACYTPDTQQQANALLWAIIGSITAALGMGILRDD